MCRTTDFPPYGDSSGEVALAALPDCAVCGYSALDHEEMAGACPGERGWYRASAREHDPITADATALPVRRVDPMQPAMVRDWTLDHRGTRYRLRVVRFEDERMLATSFGTEPYGRWWTLPADDHEWIAWSYVAEKLQLRDGDQQAWCALILHATGVVVE